MEFDTFPTQHKGQPKNFVIYRSSAGSGKTYTLTREYLALALQSPNYFRTILAVTFTNKATQEMKTRIIESLQELSSGQVNAMQQDLQKATGLKPQALQQRASQVLSAILHDYSWFAVSTIDSFFQQVIRAFSKEIGLPAGFKVELEQDKVLEALIDMLLQDVGHKPQLRNWLIQYAADRVEEGKAWDIRQDIKNLAGEIFREDFKRHEKKLQQVAREPKRFSHFLQLLKTERKIFESQMEAIGKQALQLIEDYGLQAEDFSYGSSGVAGYFRNILAEHKKYTPGTRVVTALQGAEKWYRKGSKNKEAIENAVHNGLDELLQKAISLYEQGFKQYNSARQLLSFFYTFGILTSLTDKLREYRENYDLMLISDAAVFLREIIGENEAPFIYEKTGSHYQHFLIDEFQDTSGFQWENFRPLVANSVAAGHYNMVVGDTKQSIYRWRGGDWQLLLDQVARDIGNAQTKNVELLHNWRSCREIIAFNNSLFFQAAEALQLTFLEQLTEIKDEAEAHGLAFEAAKISRAYKDVFQLFPAIKATPGRCGFVHIQFLEKSSEGQEKREEKSEGDDEKYKKKERERGKDEGDDEEIEKEEEGTSGWKASARQQMIHAVETLQDNAYLLKDIALLVRTKGEGKELAEALMQAEENKAPGSRYRYLVVSNESLFLDGAASVNLLLNILRYLNNPKDQVARATMVFDYQYYILHNKAMDQHEIFRNAAAGDEQYEQYLPAGFVEKRPYFNKLPLYELVESLILEFELNRIKSEWAYLQAFQDALLNFTKTERGDISSFLEWWSDSGHKLSVQISESLDAIRIYTIHTAKGLQLKAVIVPYCHWKFDHNTRFNNILWTEPSQEPFKQMPVLPVRYSSRLKDTVFWQAYYRERMKAYLDNLNLLYVAFTRAEECLYAWGPLPGFDKKSGIPGATEVSGLLYGLLSGIHADQQENEKQLSGEVERDVLELSTYWQKNTHTFSLGKLEQAVSAKEENEPGRLELENYYTNRWRNRLALRRRSASLAYTREGEDPASINWNISIHSILSRIKTAADLPEVMEEVYFEGLISRKEQQLIHRHIETLLAKPVLAECFSAGWKVRTELPILGSGGYITRPDRVVTRDNRAIALDFKTGKATEADEKRVKSYLHLLRQMNYQQVQGYLLYLDTHQLHLVK